jgi:hypothetical protein
VRFHDVTNGALLAVDGPVDASCGHFDLDVKAQSVQTNNRCEGAEPVSTTVHENPGDATDEYRGSCATGDGNDLAYALHVNTRTRYDIRAVEEFGGFTPIVYVRAADGCDGADIVEQAPHCGATAVGDGFGPKSECAIGGPSAHLVTTLEPRDYDLIADSQDGEGTFELDVNILEAEGDRIAGPFPVTCSDIECCTTGTTVGAATTLTAGGCNSGGTDVAYVTYEIPIPTGCQFPESSVHFESLTPQYIATSLACPGNIVFPGDCEGPTTNVDAWFPPNSMDGCKIVVRIAANTNPDERGAFFMRLRHKNAACPSPP